MASELERLSERAGLHRFLLPFADHLERLPDPQRDALRSTFGLVPGPPADRFLVALAVLTLLAEVASQAPLVCVVDDAQWVDPESAVVLGFVARRLYAERVVLLFALRDRADQLPALAGLPELVLGGLDKEAAIQLLASLAPGPLSPAVGARIIAGTGGNPLALVEVVRELSAAQLAGAEVLPEPLPIGGSLEQVYRCRVSRLPPETRLLLAVAAASRPARRRWCGARPGSWVSIRTRPRRLTWAAWPRSARGWSSCIRWSARWPTTASRRGSGGGFIRRWRRWRTGMNVRIGWRGIWRWRRPGLMRRWRPGWSRRPGMPASAGLCGDGDVLVPGGGAV